MSEVHCTAWIHCDPKDFDFVKQTLQDHGMLDETDTTDSSVIFSAMYFNSDDATCIIDSGHTMDHIQELYYGRELMKKLGEPDPRRCYLE